MTKRVTLFIFIVLFFSKQIAAQLITNERVLKLSSQYLKLEQQLNYARALSLAKEKKWDTEIKLSNGGIAKLMGVDEFGFPNYKSKCFMEWRSKWIKFIGQQRKHAKQIGYLGI
jgi:hypothetical protein